jgi:hypothetical protein
MLPGFLKSFYYRRIKPQLTEAFNDILHPGNHPRATAISMAIGMFIAIFIPMGFQIWAMLILLTFYKYNIVLAKLISYVSNPFTILPIYYAAINIGEMIFQKSFPWSLFNNFIDDPVFDKLMLFGFQGSAIFFSGLLFLAVVLSATAYFSTLKLAFYLRARHSVSMEKH